ncbi:hypothetical protein DEFDS_1336 [Deferribacter desulfuricans SSM1]|uniref:FecR protein domain-containing protein n=1 Tax=Deferribacter desulfuricans (strain DSM 14783 / JCM 11476 / NBRC 101012 / SSM1) TaxID=639282 RepID=D3PDX6_DEFDS|nr:FecR family protein [Deferribacter desulfuricans]BAI80799.1 hypothetical protein DEFDS_1336 [Deferribacter desulfuricans SSM1]
MRRIFYSFLILVLSINIASAELKVYFGKVIKLSGTPLINGKKARLRKKVFVGDKIVTDASSSISIRLKNKTVFVISPDSEVILTKTDKNNKKTEIELKKGSLRSLVTKLKPGNSYNVVSSGAVAGVKGTEFIAYSNENALCVFTEEGVVAVSTDNGSVETKKKEMSQASRDLAPLNPVNFDQDETLKDMFHTLLSITDFEIPDELEKSKRLPDIIARWNINYSKYLADAKRYEEALKSLDYAVLFAKSKEFKSEAIYRKSILKSKHMNDINGAKILLNQIIDQYPGTTYYEYALFQLGFIAYEQKDYISCKGYFQKYKEQFPEGRFISTVDVILNLIPEQS